MDRVAAAVEAADGLTIHPPDAKGRLQLEAHGELVFFSGEREFRKVRLPAGGRVGFLVDDFEGEIQAQGEAAPPDPLVGQRIGGHQILGRLGAGAVGVVYRALQVNLDREVALKLLDARIAADPAKVESFRREARAAGKLSHPHLVQVHDVGEDQGRYYYTMELVPGGNYEERLAQQGPLSWAEAASAARDCARALAYAQEHHLVHRDVKPENLMVGNGDIAKLADLGLATTRGMVDQEGAGGTPHFMAPETVGSDTVDPRTDLYSLGCTLYRLLTGHTVFEGDNVREILLAHRDEEPPTLRESGVDAPRELDDLLASLLSKDPDLRPASAEEVAATLEQILLNGGKRSSRRLVAVLLVAVLAVAGWQLTRPDPKPVDPDPDQGEGVSGPVNPGPDAATQAELARQREQTAYYQALAAAEGQSRKDALEAFLVAYPESSFAAEALKEIRRQEQLLANPDTPSVDPAEQERLLRLAAATSAVRETLADGNLGQAMSLVQSGEFVGTSAFLDLQVEVEDVANTAFLDWESQHQTLLDGNDWGAAQALRDGITTAIGSSPPQEWSDRLATLTRGESEARQRAVDQRFRTQRLDFLAAAREPVRDAVRNFDFATALELWQSAADACEHPQLGQLAAAEAPVLEQAQLAWAGIVRNASAGGTDINEAVEGRKAEVLGVSPEGLKVLVQIRGERVERTDAWALYLDPTTLAALLPALAGADAADPEALAACWKLLAWDDLATRLCAWEGVPATAEVEGLMARLNAWRLETPWPDQWQQSELDLLQRVDDLAQALLKEDDFLAFNRLQDLQARFTLFAAWISGGEATWGLQP